MALTVSMRFAAVNQSRQPRLTPKMDHGLGANPKSPQQTA